MKSMFIAFGGKECLSTDKFQFTNLYCPLYQ